MFFISKKIVWVLMLTLVLMPLASANELKTISSQKLQARYSHNFLKFVSWNAPVTKSQFVFCVLLSDASLSKVWSSLNNKKITQGRIAVKYFTNSPSVNELSTCHTIYVDSSFPYQRLKGHLVKNNSLTIVQDDIAAKDIGVFVFSQNGQRLEFTVNLTIARNKGIQVDTSLLLLAKEVIK